MSLPLLLDTAVKCFIVDAPRISLESFELTDNFNAHSEKDFNFLDVLQNDFV